MSGRLTIPVGETYVSNYPGQRTGENRGLRDTEREELKTRLMELVVPITGDLSLELVDVQIAGGARHPIVRVFIDKPGGVTVDDCAAVSRRYSVELDNVDLIETSYTLEVSSPGLDRPLVTPADFRRKQGKEVHVRLKDTNTTVTGVVVSAEQMLMLQTPAGPQEIAFERVEKGLLRI